MSRPVTGPVKWWTFLDGAVRGNVPFRAGINGECDRHTSLADRVPSDNCDNTITSALFSLARHLPPYINS